MQQLKQDSNLVISDWKFARMATETFWMPHSPHATQKSSMANLGIAASTDSASTFSSNQVYSLFLIHKIQEFMKRKLYRCLLSGSMPLPLKWLFQLSYDDHIKLQEIIFTSAHDLP